MFNQPNNLLNVISYFALIPVDEVPAGIHEAFPSIGFSNYVSLVEACGFWSMGSETGPGWMMS
jgi:hypothetical protein